MQAEWTRVGVYVVCVDDGGRLLLTRIDQAGNPDTGSWTLPGGGMEWGEQPVDTAHREVEEETGYTIDLGPMLEARSWWFTAEEAHRGSPGHGLGLIYRASIAGGAMRNEFDPADSTDAAAWWTLDEIDVLPRVRIVDRAVQLIADGWPKQR